MLTPAHIQTLMVATVLTGTVLWSGRPPVAAATAQSDVRVEVTANDRTATVENGSVTGGRTSADVRVETQINGQELAPLDISLPSATADRDLTVRQETTARDDQPPSVKMDVRLNGRPLTIDDPEVTTPTAPAAPSAPDGPTEFSPPTPESPPDSVSFTDFAWGVVRVVWRNLIEMLLTLT